MGTNLIFGILIIVVIAALFSFALTLSFLNVLAFTLASLFSLSVIAIVLKRGFE